MDPRVRFVLIALKDGRDRELTSRELAQLVNLSESRLRHLFRQDMGMSIARYQRMVRISSAKELLESTLLSIKQIRNKVCERDKDRFTIEFKKMYGLTPSQYRAHFLSHSNDESIKQLATSRLQTNANKDTTRSS